MPKVAVNLNNHDVEELVKQLDIAEKIRLVRKLEQETLQQRWSEIFRDIDKRLRKFPVSKKELCKEIKKYRREKYAKGRN